VKTTWAAMNKSLEGIVPTHLPGPAWASDEEAIALECEKKGIPYVHGRR
jgi:hypothetical protein